MLTLIYYKVKFQTNHINFFQVIVSSHTELRCPECRVVVECKVDDLPPNVLLMRILEGMKNSAKPPPPESTVPPAPTTQVLQATGCPPHPPPVHIQNHQANKLHQQQILLQQKARLQAMQMQAQPNRRVVPHAFSIFEFVSKESTDLIFKKGELIILKRRVDSNWYHGEINGREGMVPSNFIQVMVPLPVPQCSALYDFKMGPQEEEGCLTFDKGAIIKVLRRVDQNWVEGRIGTNIGIFPIAFVEMNPLAKKMMESQTEVTKNQPNEPRKLPNLPEEPPSQSGSSSNSSSNPTSPQNRAFSGVKYRDYKDKRLSLNANISNRVPNVAIVQHSNRHSAEILSAPDVSMPLVSSTTDKQRVNVLKTSGQQNVPLPWGYLALYPYKPKKPDELELKKGCVYIVTERCLDGWFKGKNWREKTGVFPGNYVTALRSRDQQQLIHQGNITQTNIITSSGDNTSIPTAVPELPPRSAGTTSLLDSIFHRKSSESQPQQQNSTAVNLMKRLNIMKRSKSPVQGNPNPAFEDTTVVATPAVVKASPPVKQVAHVRSGSCPSQLLQNIQVDIGGGSTTGCGTLFGFGSQRHKPQKEKISVLSVRQQMDNHMNHRKSLSLDQNTAILKPQNSSPSAGNRHSAGPGPPVVQMRDK